MPKNLHNLNPVPDGITLKKGKTLLGQFIIDIVGDFMFASHNLAMYPRAFVETADSSKPPSFAELNYHVILLRLIVVSIASKYEDFLGEICKRALLNRHNLFGQFDPAISWKDIPEDGDLEQLWDSLADRALRNSLPSGRLSTYASALNKLGVDSLADDDGHDLLLREFIARRNIIVHSNNFPDSAYLSVVKDPK
ncbi:MAG: hypothetical protein IIB16_05470, partial [Chloroflexi bacterium]|nr:hypothetical protein [Chloroflexota bacterium]